MFNIYIKRINPFFIDPTNIQPTTNHPLLRKRRFSSRVQNIPNRSRIKTNKMDRESLRCTLLRNITEGEKEAEEIEINSAYSATDDTEDENSEKESTEESEKELGYTTAAKETDIRRKKFKKREIMEEELLGDEVVRWSFSAHKNKKKIKENEVGKREHKPLNEVGRHRSEALVKSRDMMLQRKENIYVISEQHHQTMKLKSTRVSIASKHRQLKTKKVENGGQGVIKSETENSESDESDHTSTRLRDEVLTKSRRNIKDYLKSSGYNSQRKSRKKLATSKDDWNTLRIRERQSQSFMEELDMKPMTPLPDSDSPQVFINHGQVTCHSRWPSAQ